MRVACKKCGALILPTTADRTGGICMRCKRVSEFQREAESTADDSILSIPLSLAGSKAEYFRTVVLNQAQAAAFVLTEEGLTRTDLRQRFEANPTQFAINESDLNSDGLKIKSDLRDWCSRVDCDNDSRLPTLADFLTTLRSVLGEADD